MSNTFIIYGAGNKGKWVYQFLKWRGMENRVYCFVDRNFDKIRSLSLIHI